MGKYNPSEIEPKWQELWEKSKLNEAKNGDKRPKYYCLDMFPYPSGSGLHVGHWRGYVLSDVAARVKKIEGFNVLHPMGWDAFGSPAENDAIKKGIHPKISVQQNIDGIRSQLKQIGACYDWKRELNTTDPNYYKWTQWMFLQMFKKGLAYKKEMPINWCPSCKTGISNEDVVGGECERCGTQVSKKNLNQWMIKITAYADRLLADLDKLDWPEKVKKMQSDWIGKSEGINIWYEIEGSDKKIEVYTTRPDTNFGATFIVAAPESGFVKENFSSFENQDEIKKYLEDSSKKSDIDRIAEGRKKTGVFTGLYAINHLTDKKMPIYISDFVLAHVGTGCVVGVPGHDTRDFEFAQEKNLEVIRVVIGSDGDKSPITKIEQVQEETGIMINSGFLDGMDIHEATKAIMDHLEEKGWGKRAHNYKMRDWVFARQRYWGEPIPIVICEKCGPVPIEEKDLPLLLPEIEKYEPTGTGESPLAAVTDWVNTTCPRCRGPAKRETDTMPQWAGSCWYFLGYALSPDALKAKEINFINPEFKALLKEWLPADLYVGGIEHAVLHLLYSRFWTKFLCDIGAVEFDEPFNRLFNQGMIYKLGAKMSKSKGNVVSPDDMIARYGTDALRGYELFMAPPDQDAEWSDSGVPGVHRFLNKVWDLGVEIAEITESASVKKILEDSFEIGETELEVTTHKTIKKFNEALESFRYNTLISTLMEFTNFLQSKKELLYTYPQPYLILVMLLSPIAPHIAEEIWNQFGFTESIFSGAFSWPKHDPEKIKEDFISIVVQENGKLRGNILVPTNAEEAEVLKICNDSPKLVEICSNPKKMVYVKNRLINIVK